MKVASGDSRSARRTSVTATTVSKPCSPGARAFTRAPRLQVDLGLEVGASHNSKSDDVPYFNPKSDSACCRWSTSITVLYRRYETSWSQQFQAGAGTYSQRDHGTGGVGLLGYGQRYSWNDVFEVGGHVERDQPAL